MADHGGAALGAGFDGFEEFSGGRRLEAEEIGGDEDRGESIINIVGDPAGELADAFEALSSLGLLLGSGAFGDVAEDFSADCWGFVGGLASG